MPTLSIPDWLKPLYPFSPRSFRTAGGALMSYLDEGKGTRAVAMLHGNPTWSFYYRELVKSIAPNRRCIVPDHIGMGLSEKPETYNYTLDTRIRDVGALIDSLGVTELDLVVHDWGGAIGFGLAALRPQMVRSITILNTAAFPSEHLPKRIGLCKIPGFGPLLVRGANGFAWPATWMSMHRRALTNDQSRAYLLPYDSWANRVAVSAFVQDIPMDRNHPTWNVLARTADGISKFFDRRTLIVWGGRDFCFNDHFYREWRKRMPHAEVCYLEDAGHYVLEDAAEQVVPLITDHILAQ